MAAPPPDIEGDEGIGGGVPPGTVASVPGVPAAGDWLFDPAYTASVLDDRTAEHSATHCTDSFNAYLGDLLAVAPPTPCGGVDEGSGGGCDVAGTGGAAPRAALPIAFVTRLSLRRRRRS